MSFSAAEDLRRKGGVEEDGALVCRKGACPTGIVAFGPYTRAVPAGPRVATFRLRGKAMAGHPGEVAKLDVYDARGKQRLAVLPVRAEQLPDGQEQSIDVPFTAPENGKLEFRVAWSGEGELHMYRVDVR